MSVSALLADIYVMIDPVAKARARVTKWGAYTPKKSKDFDTELKDYLKQVWGRRELLDIPVSLEIEFQLPKPKVKRDLPAVKPDIDNYVKAVMDCLNKTILKDDGAVCDLIARKRYRKDGFPSMINIK